MSDEKTIVQFPRGGDVPECPVAFERDFKFCRHGKVRLVEHDRSVVCAECGQSIDPFAYLVGEAYAVRRAWDDYGEVSRRAKELREKVSDLERERKRLTAAVKRLKEKVGDDGVLDLRGRK